MPDDALEALRERAAKRHLSLAAYAREVLVREAARATMEETLAGPRAITGRRLTAREVKRLIRAGRAQVLVTDAGAWVRALLDEAPDGPVRARLRREAYVDAPALIDLEFLSAVRGLLSRKLVSRVAAEESIERFLSAPIDRHAHGPLAWRTWELRANLTPYDASYVALAEMLGTALLTVDSRLSRAPLIRCAVELAQLFATHYFGSMTATTPDPLIPPLVAQAIELARRRDFSGSCSLEVGRLLRVLASQHRRGTVAEIGTGCGVGAAWIIAGLASTAEFVTVELEVARAGAVAQLFSGYSNVTILPGDWSRLRDRAPFVMLFADAVAPSKPAWLPAPELGTG